MKGLGKTLRIEASRPRPRWLAALLLVGASVACTADQVAPDGTCQSDPVVDCSVNGMPADSIHLAGYSCTGTVRPDSLSTYVDGVPQGTVCAEKGAVGTNGNPAYCCTTFTTRCAYDPAAYCPSAGNYGYQCRGADRPEALNPAISCNQGIRENDLINYCCSGEPIPQNCIQSDAIGCWAGMTGWTCPVGTQPTAQDLGANKSRADLYYLLCPVPTPAPNPKYETYCCYVPTLNPAGGTCLQDRNVPGCAPGRFGIACYGTDRPEDNFPRLVCPDPGTPGTSEQGYPATVYCCDFAKG